MVKTLLMPEGSRKAAAERLEAKEKQCKSCDTRLEHHKSVEQCEDGSPCPYYGLKK